MNLCSVGDKYGAVCFMNRSIIAVTLQQEGERHAIARTYHDTMDFGNFSTVFEDYSARYWLESIEMLRILSRKRVFLLGCESHLAGESW